MKRTFFLFEILVALSLMGGLLSFLFSFLSGSATMQQKMERASHEITSRAKVQITFQNLFMSVRGSSFYTDPEDKKRLCLFFDHGVDPDPSFSGTLPGEVSVDEEGNLLLVYGEETKRTEILLKGVSDLSFQFLSREKKWISTWPKGEIPSLLRMTLKQDGELLRFAFCLPEVEPMATWSSG